MAQPPFLVDAVQIEPGSGQTLTISRRASDGSLKFLDTLIPAGITLSELSGLRNVTGVYVVGRGGSGAAYTTIQSALDAIPTSSSVSLPSIVLVLPGTYAENLAIQKDGVSIVGLGGVYITNDGAADTITISASLDVVPKDVLLRNLSVTNDEIAKCCVKILGADSFASGTVTVTVAPLATGNTVTIGGIPLVGIAGARTTGFDNFSVSGGTVSQIAAEIVDAVNDPNNSFSEIVFASSNLGVVTLEAIVAGSGGNGIALASNIGTITVSGGFLTGGSAAGNDVGSGEILIDECDLIASGAGAYQVLADTVNYVFVRGGSFYGSSGSSQIQASNTAVFSVEYVSWMNNAALSYDTGEDRPADTSSFYRFTAMSRMLDFEASFIGAGSLEMSGCLNVGDLTLGGDQGFIGRNSNFFDISLSGTIAATLRECSRNSVSVAGGAPTLIESTATGTLDFMNSASETFTFPVASLDSDYRIVLDSPVTSEILAVTSRDANGFTVEASGLITGTVGWILYRNVVG